MSIENIKNSLPEWAKDNRINLGNVLQEEHAPGLSQKQILGCAVSVAMTLKNSFLVKELLEASHSVLTEQDIQGIKQAVSIMGMNNIYYRTVHLAEDKDLSQRPAQLRMTMMSRPGIDGKDFEIYSLAISAVAGCGMCIKSHSHKLKQEGLTPEGVQSIIRIASVVTASHQTLDL